MSILGEGEGALAIPTIITYDEINVHAHIYIEFERASIITKLTFVS